MRWESTAEIRSRNPGRVEALREQFESQGLSPIAITQMPRSLALVDLVYSGQTLGNVVEFWLTWARELDVDLRALRSKFRFVGVTLRTKNSPNTWRWQQQVAWMKSFPQRLARNVSTSRAFWTYLGNDQKKTVDTYPPWRWGESEHQSPKHDDEHLDALALAVHLYESGRESRWRTALAQELAGKSQIREQWLRTAMRALRASGT